VGFIFLFCAKGGKTMKIKYMWQRKLFMKRDFILIMVSLLAIYLIPQSSYSCTTFCIDKGGQLIVGYNMDWIDEQGSIFVNKRNVSKTALMYLGTTDCQPVKWTAKYGSVIFTFAGREFPLCGMNEAGLVINILRLLSSHYPPSDSRQCISATQWIQYHLDNSATVEGVIASDSHIRILPPPSQEGDAHFFICDSTGKCAVIEFIGGKMVYYTKETMPAKVLSNDRYDECIADLDKYKSWGGDLSVPQSGGAYDRFIRAADMVRNYDPPKSKSIFDYAFSILADVEWSMPTQWSIVYDVKNLRISYHTSVNKQMRHIDLKTFNFSCKTPVKVLDVNGALSGDVTKQFTDYSYERNRDDLKKILEIPEEALNVISRYPESTVCTE